MFVVESCRVSRTPIETVIWNYFNFDFVQQNNIWMMRGNFFKYLFSGVVVVNSVGKLTGKLFFEFSFSLE